ncbi:DUF3823 domain-containing protein [Pseudobacter ginsenosidimutans]|uniref:Uncharacterized protein DUF3823 n=1 Tax=Pseudobacter ginsenosidimutans TaxID=661488 RepID=A0A4Q7N2X6_9BACT|nr:DUF3823 domain-containing protein [Pseudobacter ginsenosidimutans]QEC43215.1 DUF3823 domain-containing protein [Pseudobacter ginsenosidimutans]RZS74575.1 uncharacterized protein DUF3823 [Pseudobacter ginsenosidimutans]
MKKFFLSILLLLSLFAVVSCKKDNYDPPSVTLQGKLVYNGEAIGVEHDKVTFELYQHGFGKTGPMGNTFKQDGSYSMLLFNGEYKLIVPNGQGPFQWKQKAQGGPDSVVINVNGNQTIDLPVTPYYMIRNPQLTAGSGKVSASFSIEKIITDATARNIENVALYINRTQFVSGTDNNGSASVNGGDITDPSSLTLSVNIPSMNPSQNYIFARIGLKIEGLEDRIFSPLVKLSF